MVEFHEISEKEWEKMPPPQPSKPPNQWEDVLEAVAAGKIVKIKVGEKHKGVRIGLARTAASRRNMKLQFRLENGELAVRKDDRLIEPKEPRERKPRRRKGEIEKEDTGEAEE